MIAIDDPAVGRSCRLADGTAAGLGASGAGGVRGGIAGSVDRSRLGPLGRQGGVVGPRPDPAHHPGHMYCVAQARSPARASRQLPAGIGLGSSGRRLCGTLRVSRTIAAIV